MEPVAGTTVIEEAHRGPPVGPPPDRDVWPWLLVLLVLVLAGVAAAYFVTRDDDKRAETTAPVTTIVTTLTQTTTPTTTATTAPRARVTLANLLGIPVETAQKRLVRDGLNSQLRDVDSSKPKGIVAGQAPGPGTQLAKGETVRLDVSKGPPAVVVPQVVGLDQQRAVETLEARGLDANTVLVSSGQPKGKVVAQNPRGGEQLARGETVRLNISNGPAQTTTATRPTTATTAPTTTASATTAPSTTTPTTSTTATTPARVQVPDVTGLKLRQARTRIRNAGLITEVTYVPNQQPEGTVVAQSPKPGQTRTRGDHVLINISLGPKPKPLATVPDVVGQDETTATDTLEQAGFVVFVSDIPTDDPAQDGIVADLQPAAGSQAPRGSEVTIYVARHTG